MFGTFSWPWQMTCSTMTNIFVRTSCYTCRIDVIYIHHSMPQVMGFTSFHNIVTLTGSCMAGNTTEFCVYNWQNAKNIPAHSTSRIVTACPWNLKIALHWITFTFKQWICHPRNVKTLQFGKKRQVTYTLQILEFYG